MQLLLDLYMISLQQFMLALISSRVNPLPARSFLWYRTVGHRTIGRKGPAAGLGAMARAFFILVCLLLYLRAG